VEQEIQQCVCVCVGCVWGREGSVVCVGCVRKCAKEGNGSKGKCGREAKEGRQKPRCKCKRRCSVPSRICKGVVGGV